jgi:hypothetical protein
MIISRNMASQPLEKQKPIRITFVSEAVLKPIIFIEN